MSLILSSNHLGGAFFRFSVVALVLGAVLPSMPAEAAKGGGIAICRRDPLTGMYTQINIPSFPALLRRRDCIMDDGNVCTQDLCHPIVSCVHEPLSCSDDDVCTDDSCEPGIGCINEERDCDDGTFCNGAETCDPDTGDCVAVSACPPMIDGCVIRNGECDEENNRCVDVEIEGACDDEDPCTTDTCDLATGSCSYEDVVCADDLFCNGEEMCDPDTGDCVAVSACPPMFDGCVIRNGQCDEESDRCVDVEIKGACDDEDSCTLDRCDLATGDCLHDPACAADEDCQTSLCIIASCLDGCCVAISACPPSTGGCRNYTGECIEESGDCVFEDAPNGTRCDSSTGSTDCVGPKLGELFCDSVCQDGVCINPSNQP